MLGMLTRLARIETEEKSPYRELYFLPIENYEKVYRQYGAVELPAFTSEWLSMVNQSVDGN